MHEFWIFVKVNWISISLAAGYTLGVFLVPAPCWDTRALRSGTRGGEGILVEFLMYFLCRASHEDHEDNGETILRSARRELGCGDEHEGDESNDGASGRR